MGHFWMWIGVENNYESEYEQCVRVKKIICTILMDYSDTFSLCLSSTSALRYKPPGKLWNAKNCHMCINVYLNHEQTRHWKTLSVNSLIMSNNETPPPLPPKVCIECRKQLNLYMERGFISVCRLSQSLNSLKLLLHSIHIKKT